MINYNKKIKLISLFILAILNFSLLTFNINSVNAQEITLSISPSITKIVTNPGKSLSISYKIENRGDPSIVKVKILPFEPQDNQGNIKIKNELDGAINFVLNNEMYKFNQPFFLKTKDSAQFSLKIKVPSGAPNGDYYYSLLAENQPPPSTEGSSSARSKITIGSNILISINNSNKTEVKGKIALFDLLPRFKINFFSNNIKLIDSSDIIPIILIVNNLGKNLFQPVGIITLRNSFGANAEYAIIPKNILAESQRIIIATPSTKINCINNTSYLCSTPATLLISGFFIGKYNIATNINFGDGTPNLYASTSFIALPFKILISLVLTIFIAVLIVKHINKQQDN